MALVLDVLTHIDERSAALSARQLEREFEVVGRGAGASFAANLAQGMEAGFHRADFGSMLGVLSTGAMTGEAATHGSVLGAAFAGGVVVAASAALVDLGVKVGEVFENINRDITLHTAASGKALDELKGHADALVGSLDSSAAHIGGDMATLATRLQMTAGPALDQLTKNVEMLRDRMGDFNVGALAGALQNMGVTGAQANDTLASLAATVQRTNIPLSELSTDLAANSDLFKDMHLSAGQAANMLGEISAKGVPAATAIMGLQMGMKAAKTQGEDFNTFIRRIADSLDYYGKKGDEVSAEELSLAVGGPRKWADLQTAAHAYLDTVQQGSAAFAGHSQDLTDLGNQTKTLGNYWDEVKNKISAALAPPGLSVTDEVGQKMEELISFIDAHSDDLRQLFETSLQAIGAVVEDVGKLAALLGRHPALIQAVAVAFGTWEAIKGVDTVLTGLEAVGAWLVGAPAVAETAAAGVDAAMTGMAATTTAAAGEMTLAFGPIMGELPVIATEAETAGTAIATSMTAADGAIVALNASMDTAMASLAGIAAAAAPLLAVAGGVAALFGLATATGSATGQEDTPDYTKQGATALGPDGKPLLGPDGKPIIAGMRPGSAPGPGTGVFAPGQGPDVGGRAAPTLPGAPAVADPDANSGGPPGDLLTPADLDPAKKGPKGPRLPEAPQVPYPAGYGAPPRPGESAEQYDAEQRVLEERHHVEEARARLNQLEHYNNANADDIQKARNDLLHAQQTEYSAELGQLKKHTEDMQQLGAKIDNDFGISKGLPGIAENLTKFLANLAFAPALGAMAGTQAGLGFPGGQGLGGAQGLLGMAGLSGAFGPQFTVGGGGASSGGRGSGLGGLLGGLTGGGAGAIGGAQIPGVGGAGFAGIAMPGDKETYTTSVLAGLGLPPLFQNPGDGGNPEIPGWVQDFVHTYGGPGLTAGSTPHGSLHGNAAGAGYAVDVTGDPAQQDRLAAFLRANPSMSAQMIHQSTSGEDMGVAGGQDVSGRYYTTPGGTYGDEAGMVHWAPAIRPDMAASGPAAPQPAGQPAGAAVSPSAYQGPGGPTTPAQQAAYDAMLKAGFAPAEWPALKNILGKESSGGDPTARNPKSGAFGMYQFLGHENDKYGKLGGYSSDPAQQSTAGMAYIADRYGSPSAAWAHWQQAGSYHQGGAVGYATGGPVPQGGPFDTPTIGGQGSGSGGGGGLPGGFGNPFPNFPGSLSKAAAQAAQGYQGPTPGPADIAGHAAGGTAGGPGSGPGPRDTIPAMLAPGEHVLTSQDVNAMGGQQAVYQFRAGLHGPGPSPGPGAAAGAVPTVAPSPVPTPPGGAPASKVGGLGAPAGLGSGFTVTGGGLIGVAESIPATVINEVIQAGIDAGAAGAAAQYGGATEDVTYFAGGGAAEQGAGGAGPGGSGGAGGTGAGGGSPGGGASTSASAGSGGTGAGGGGSPGGSVVSAAIGIGIQEINEAISKGGQAAGAVVGGLDQTFGPQQFAQSSLAQSGWIDRIIGGIAGAQPQLPNMAGQHQSAAPEGVPVMAPMGSDIPGAATSVPGPPAPVLAPVRSPSGGPPHPASVPAPPAIGNAAAGRGPESLYGAAPTPNSVIGSAGGFEQGGDVSSSSGGSGPAVYIEHYHDEGDSHSAGQDIGRHVEASYAAQSTPGAR